MSGYRWYYVDAVFDDLLVVAIFMHAPVFSARELGRRKRGTAPTFSAINVAIYREGRREAWVFSERADGDIAADGITIGASTLTFDGPAARIHVDARQSPWPKRLQLDLELTATAPSAREVVLDKEGDHRWQALMPRAKAKLTLGAHTHDGHGYHDTNHGQQPLGVGLPRWRWTRVHGNTATDIYYQLPDAPLVHVHAQTADTQTFYAAGTQTPAKTSGWGLPLPNAIAHDGHLLSAGKLIESSPFYARLWHRQGGIDALTEVADFARFRSPLFSWMSYFRSRLEAV